MKKIILIIFISISINLSAQDETINGNLTTVGNLKISDLTTSLSTGDIIGKLEFHKSDASTGGAGVPTYIQSRAYDLGGLFELDFITGSVSSPANTMTLGRYGLDIKGISESIKISDQKTSLTVGDVIGKLEFHKSDTSTGGAGVPTYIQSRSKDLGGLFELDFITGSVSSPVTAMTLGGTGNVGIGTSDTKGYKLGVNGKIVATEVKVALYDNWADFVFDKNYNLPTLTEVENHIREKGHLKDIPSTEEVKKNGIHLGEMDAKLLQKIEELTLYTIEQEKKIKELESLNSKLIEIQERLEKLETK